jgi:hypothetical protein
LVEEKLRQVEESDKLRNFQPVISGEIIMKTFDLKPSREVGILKEALTEAILEGHIRNEFEAAYPFLLKEGKKLNLEPVLVLSRAEAEELKTVTKEV